MITLQKASVEDLVRLVEEELKCREYKSPHTTEQLVECAFLAGWKLGRNETITEINKIIIESPITETPIVIQNIKVDDSSSRN